MIISGVARRIDMNEGIYGYEYQIYARIILVSLFCCLKCSDFSEAEYVIEIRLALKLL